MSVHTFIHSEVPEVWRGQTMTSAARVMRDTRASRAVMIRYDWNGPKPRQYVVVELKDTFAGLRTSTYKRCRSFAEASTAASFLRSRLRNDWS